MARFTRTLGTLLTNGVPIVTSFDIVKNIIDNKLISTAIERARDDIKEGKEVSKPLASSGIFPPVVVNMIAVGEKSGQLELALRSFIDIVFHGYFSFPLGYIHDLTCVQPTVFYHSPLVYMQVHISDTWR